MLIPRPPTIACLVGTRGRLSLLIWTPPRTHLHRTLLGPCCPCQFRQPPPERARRRSGAAHAKPPSEPLGAPGAAPNDVRSAGVLALAGYWQPPCFFRKPGLWPHPTSQGTSCRASRRTPRLCRTTPQPMPLSWPFVRPNSRPGLWRPTTSDERKTRARGGLLGSIRASCTGPNARRAARLIMPHTGDRAVVAWCGAMLYLGWSRLWWSLFWYSCGGKRPCELINTSITVHTGLSRCL